MPAATRLGGNRSTADRLAEALITRGHVCEVVELEIDAAVPTADTDLLVALHAVRTGIAVAHAAEAAALPWVCVFTGTDLNGKPPAAAVQALRSAKASVTLAPHAQKRAQAVYEVESTLIPQAARPLPEPRGGAPLPADCPPLERSDFLVLQPLAVRAVKAPTFGLRALRSLAKSEPRLRLWIVGPSMEDEAAAELQKALQGQDWAHWLDGRSRKDMAGLMRRANTALSTSRSEGAAPNALLEAALFSKPILASDIPAHRYFPGATFIYRSEDELRHRIQTWIDDPAKAALDGRQLREETRTRFDLVREAVEWDRLVLRVLGGE